MKVYKAIASVMAELAKEGISKDRKNQQQGYNFRGIDDVYNALSGPLARNGLVILPRVTDRQCEERQTAKGSPIFYVTVKVDFTIACAEDGSVCEATMYGEAMDSADKATNKAMSAAYKYLAMELFCIPTEGDNDADAHTHAVTAKPSPALSRPTGADEWQNLSADERAAIESDYLMPMRVSFQQGDVDGCVLLWNTLKGEYTDHGTQVGAWHQLDSKIRSAIKAHGKSAA